jgi:hypothetical protein
VRELDLSGAHAQQARLAVRLGQVGWIALGLVYGFPGDVHRGGDDVRPDDADHVGLRAPCVGGGALRRAVDRRAVDGPVGFGVYCFFDARYRKA